MRRVLLALFVFAFSAFAANVKLYLKDGGYQLVREYQVQPDRVRYYSVERSQWEELPLNLVDLKRTESEVAERKTELAVEAKVISEEDQAERGLREEIAKIPQDPGAYYLEDNAAKPIKVGEAKVHNNKGRNVLKATLELDGVHSSTVLTDPEHELFIQLSNEERFGIIKLTPEDGVRIVEKLTIIPVSKEIIEEPIEVAIFRKQLTQDGLYKIWPVKPFEPGEYAVVEFTPGKVNMQVWDFAIQPAAR
jgi:hypothetical protein